MYIINFITNYLSTDCSQFLQFVLCKFGFPWFIGFGILPVYVVRNLHLCGERHSKSAM